MKTFSQRKGFTLVELLIVIVVIGVLSAMMMLSSTEAVSSAKASNIISNLRNLKTAVLSWYADNMDRVIKDGDNYKILDSSNTKKSVSDFISVSANSEEILKYLSSGSSIRLREEKQGDDVVGAYILKDFDSKKGKWAVGYKMFNEVNKADKSLCQKIAARAKALGLKNNKGNDYTWSSKADTDKYIFMPVLTLANE